MIQRHTQNADYWGSFSVTPADLEFLRTVLLDSESPMTTGELANALVAERCRREEAELRAELSRGVLYQPKKRYPVGEKVIFPALDFRLGEVVATRPGENPEHGDFEVVTVDFGAGKRQRHFAAGLNSQHKLNADAPEMLLSGDLASPERLLATSAKDVPVELAAALAQTEGFIGFEDRWYLQDLTAEIHIGHLNIAEALIEMHEGATDTADLVKDLDLPAEVKPSVLAFSLQSAMTRDGRFDQVGPGHSRRWYLRRLAPPEALEVPRVLRYTPEPFDRSALPAALQKLEFELDDEWSDGLHEAGERAAQTTSTLLLLHPHLISGTIPLNRHSRAIFPKGHGERTLVTLIDGRWGQRFSGWVVHEGRFVAGLRGWYEKHKLPAGAFLTLERRDDQGEVVVDFRPKRMRREWTRWAQVTEGGRMDVQLRKQEVSCEYDEDVIIGDDRGEDILKLRDGKVYGQASLAELVFEVFTDLAGLSQTGAVHAKTIYSTINVVRRCPPGPIFHVLTDDSRFEAVGEGSFRLAS